MRVVEPAPEGEKPPRPRRNWKRGCLFTVIGIVLACGGFLQWQPWEYDWVERKIPNPNPPVNPDRERLFAKGTKIVLVTAHPDDSEFYIGATLSKLGKTAEIHQILCTDGDKAYYGPFTNADENRRVRRIEAEAAAKAWGAKEVIFLSYPDGRLRLTDQLVGRIREVIDRVDPDYVLAFDDEYPQRRSHQDHRRAGEATVRAAKESGKPDWLLLFSGIAPNFVLDITDSWATKRALLQMHESQWRGREFDRIAGMVRRRSASDGRRIGVELGEGFRAVQLKSK